VDPKLEVIFQMQQNKSELVAPVLLVAVGVGWLLSSLKIVPEVVWFWPLGLAAAGILMLIVQGINRVSIVLGPFLVWAALLSVARQAGPLTWETEMPLLLIGLGILLLVAMLFKLPSGSGEQ
jgi:hypothetical protein